MFNGLHHITGGRTGPLTFDQLELRNVFFNNKTKYFLRDKCHYLMVFFHSMEPPIIVPLKHKNVANFYQSLEETGNSIA